MWLEKAKGGSGILWHGTEYSWPDDGSVCEIPDDLARDLLAIPGGGFTEVPGPAPGEDGEPETPRRTRKPPASSGDA